MSIAITVRAIADGPTIWRSECTDCQFHLTGLASMSEPPRLIPHMHMRSDGAVVWTDGEHEQVVR